MCLNVLLFYVFSCGLHLSHNELFVPGKIIKAKIKPKIEKGARPAKVFEYELFFPSITLTMYFSLPPKNVDSLKKIRVLR